MDKKNIFAKVNAVLAQRRKAAEEKASAEYARAMADPAFAKAENTIRQLTPVAAYNDAFGIKDDKIKRDLDAAYAERNAALKKTGARLEPEYTCPLCNDSGNVNGTTCKCAVGLYREFLRDECNLSGIPAFTFADDKSDMLDCTQKDDLNKLYRAMREFADKFPDSGVKLILLLGYVGTGKSSVIAAVANRLVERGFYVMYTTAFEFNNLMLKYHTSNSESKTDIMDNVLDADVLVIDDLGTEPVFRNVTKEYLFSVLDSRTVGGKTTILTSNLSAGELLDRYGERIYSRLTNKRYSLVRMLKGDDLRMVRPRNSSN